MQIRDAQDEGELKLFSLLQGFQLCHLFGKSFN